MTTLAEIPTMPWRVIEWTDENGRTVRELAFHKEETQEVLDLPFPAGRAIIDEGRRRGLHKRHQPANAD